MSDQDKWVKLDKDFILNDDNWPNWPLLPVKLRNGKCFEDPEGFGIILAGSLTQVWIGGIFDLKEGARLKDELAKFPVKEYKSLDELLETWTVD
jgi:hypothetical protein